MKYCADNIILTTEYKELNRNSKNYLNNKNNLIKDCWVVEIEPNFGRNLLSKKINK